MTRPGFENGYIRFSRIERFLLRDSNVEVHFWLFLFNNKVKIARLDTNTFNQLDSQEGEEEIF